MARQLSTTSRQDLREGAGANTHFCFNPSVYAVGSTPSARVVQEIIDLGVGYIRERWWPHNVAQQKAFATLADAGLELYLFVGDMTYSASMVQADMALLASSPTASSVAAVCGPNEPNAHGGSTWPGRVVSIQESIFGAVFDSRRFASGMAVVGPALKHNVANIDADYLAVAAAGVQRWCQAGDFHFYPGNAGPSLNAAEAARAGEAYGDLALWHSETGWTGADTPPDMAGEFSVEALLRNHCTGIIGTILYEFADESQYVQGREGLFGLVTPTAPKTAYNAIKKLLTTRDGGQDFPGWLAPYEKQVASDIDVVVTSEGSGCWTVYLLRQDQASVVLVLPRGYTADTGSAAPGRNGNHRYTITLRDSMTVAHVAPTAPSRE